MTLLIKWILLTRLLLPSWYSIRLFLTRLLLPSWYSIRLFLTRLLLRLLTRLPLPS
jgi:hypothetical protein